MTVSISDGRLAIMRCLQSLFLDIQESDSDENVTPASLARDEEFASEMGLEVLDTLGLEVLSVEEDGSIIVKLTLEED